ncbi:MAG: hypothetical protein IJN90_07305 [Bacilli bacterium]|nr:hypothetical protein [Bacilli bacterium]
MNNKGQVLVLFIIILPILLLGCACLIDSSYMLYQKNRLDNINYDVLDSIKTKMILTEEDVERLILLNDSKIVNEDIVIDEENTMDRNISISNYILVNSIFGRLIGIDEYKVSSEVSIKINNIS